MKYLLELVKIINDNYIYARVAKFGDKSCILFLQWFMEFEDIPLSEILMACFGGKLGCINFEEKCFDHVICTKGFKAQVQFSLERGVSAVIGVIETQQLPYPSHSRDRNVEFCEIIQRSSFLFTIIHYLNDYFHKY